jgi:DNA invertase Pin-like site-specific DNA recombinase
MISERTRAALAAAKARGTKLGGYRGTKLTAKAREAGSKVRTARAISRAADLAPTIKTLQASGLTTLRGIATALSEKGIPTPRRQGVWRPTQVARILARL